MKDRVYERWAIMGSSNNRLDGYSEWLLGTYETGMSVLFRTRQEARDYPELKRYNGMLRRRRDLRIEPHGWRAYRPVKVRITIQAVSPNQIEQRKLTVTSETNTSR